MSISITMVKITALTITTTAAIIVITTTIRVHLRKRSQRSLKHVGPCLTYSCAGNHFRIRSGVEQSETRDP